MSKERLLDLQAALHNVGWNVTNEDELLTVEEEHIRWKLEYRNSDCRVEIEFYVVGDLGQESDNLNDIRHGLVCDRVLKIVFPKRNTDAWRDNVKEFSLALSRIPDSRR